jgi:hypothetical protein
VIDIPYYEENTDPKRYRVFISLQGYDSIHQEPIFEQVGAVKPSDFEALRRLLEVARQAAAMLML